VTSRTTFTGAAGFAAAISVRGGGGAGAFASGFGGSTVGGSIFGASALEGSAFGGSGLEATGFGGSTFAGGVFAGAGAGGSILAGFGGSGLSNIRDAASWRASRSRRLSLDSTATGACSDGFGICSGAFARGLLLSGSPFEQAAKVNAIARMASAAGAGALSRSDAGNIRTLPGQTPGSLPCCPGAAR
jgi:hypothetical protein